MRPSKTCDRKKPACSEQGNGGRVRADEGGEVGEGQVTASRLESAARIRGVFPQQQEKHGRASSRRANLIPGNV